MRNSNVRFTRNSSFKKVLLNKTATIVSAVGFLMFQPFLWHIVLLENNSHYMSISTFLMIIGFVIGAPMFLFGLVNIFMDGNPNLSSNDADLDISRIRHRVETDSMNRR